MLERFKVDIVEPEEPKVGCARCGHILSVGEVVAISEEDYSGRRVLCESCFDLLCITSLELMKSDERESSRMLPDERAL